MTEADALFWGLFGLLGFAFALAVQMRFFTALTLRRAAVAFEGDPMTDPWDARPALAKASGLSSASDDLRTLRAVQKLREDYARPLAHLRLARRASLVLPLMILALVAVRRFSTGGVI